MAVAAGWEEEAEEDGDDDKELRDMFFSALVSFSFLLKLIGMNSEFCVIIIGKKRGMEVKWKLPEGKK